MGLPCLCPCFHVQSILTPYPVLVFTCMPVCTLNLVGILLMLFAVVCWNKYVTTSIELVFCMVTLHFRYVELLVCYTMTIWCEWFSWVSYFKTETVLLVTEFCLTFKGCSVEDLSLWSLYLGYYTTNLTVSLMFQLFGKLSARVTTSREKIHAVKENLQACKLLLRCRRDELKKLWLEGIEHKHVLQLLEEMWVYNGKT